MAIKIIKNTMKGPIEMECEYCKSVFEYDWQDIQVKESTNLLGFKYRDRSVCCPVCRFDNVLDSNVKAEKSGNIAQDH